MKEYCCDKVKWAVENGYTLGSHYHCGRCRGETGMYGHYRKHSKMVKGKLTFEGEHHFCCPGDCELKNEA